MILSVLKIIGIVFLVILMVLIFILGILLFVPIRYRFQGSYYTEPDGMAYVRWTPLGLKVDAVFRNNKPEYTVKLFGGVIMTNTSAKISWLGRKLFSVGEEDTKEKKQGIKRQDLEDEPVNRNAEKNDDKENNIEFADKNNDIETKVAQSFQTAVEKDVKERQSLLEKLRKKLAEWKQKWKVFKQKLKDVNHKKDALLKIYHSKRFDMAKQDIKIYIKEIFRIVKPDQLEGYVHFGMEDPAVTGQILGGIAMFLPLYQGFLNVQPDFEKKCLDGNLKGKGKIYLFSIVKLALKVIFNKNLIKVTKKVQTIIEA